MTLREEIQAIINDPSLGYTEKSKRLVKFVTEQEMRALLPKPVETISLKEPLRPKREGMRRLNLSIHNVFFEEIRQGAKREEYREYKDYYIQRCTYEECGRRYLVPFDAITFYVGRAKRMTVMLRDITCSGGYFVFHLGEVLPQ